ncbi:hypothetical protein Tco_1243950 [Tanacetum coccineum]
MEDYKLWENATNTLHQVWYITAKVAGKPVTILEASIRSDLLFDDADGMDSMHNQAISDAIQLMEHLDAKKKFVMYPRFIPVFLTNQLKNVPVPLDHFSINALTTKVFSFTVKKGKKNSGNVTPLFPSMLAQSTEDEGAVSERPSETQPTPSPTHPSDDQSEPQPDPFLRPSSSNPIPNSIPEGSGGNHGDLKAQIKQLKKKAKPVISHHNAWIKSVSIKKRLARKKSLKTKLMQKESVSKQGRKPAKSEPTVHKDPAFDDLDDAMDYIEPEDAHDEGAVKKQEDDETIAQFLVIMSQNKTKQKGFEIKEIKDTDRPRTTTKRSILTLKPLPKIDPKDKGKKVLEEKAESEGVNEAERKFAQLVNDEEIARKVQEKWEAEEEKKKLAEEEATKAAFTNEYDFIQTRLNADKILAEKLQEEERENFTIEQRAKFLHDTIAAQRRFLAQQRPEAIRNKLPTRNQLRNQMMTYMKCVGGYRHAQLNKKKFEEIQVMYEKMNKKAAGMDKEEVFEEPESTKVKAKIEEPKENIRKRSRRRLKMKALKRSKRQKTDSDHEEENQLRTFLKIVPEEEEKIDYEVLGSRYPIINWESKFYDYGHFRRELIYYRVFRTDGSSRWIKTFYEMIKLFDRMDLAEVHSLVMKKFKTTPPEGIDLLLWGDLRIMFESKEDDLEESRRVEASELDIL